MIIQEKNEAPIIKLIPSDPTTNSILIIYCVSSSGVSIPFRAVWQKILSKSKKIEVIKNHSGSSYRCSPLDCNCYVQVTVRFRLGNTEISKVITSGIIKISRQLRLNKLKASQKLLCRIFLDESYEENYIWIQNSLLNCIPLHDKTVKTTLSMPVSDLLPEAEANTHQFSIRFKEKYQIFHTYFSELLGRIPPVKNRKAVFFFDNDLNRDIILLALTEQVQSNSTQSKIHVQLLLPHQLTLQNNLQNHGNDLGKDHAVYGKAFFGHMKKKSGNQCTPQQNNSQLKKSNIAKQNISGQNIIQKKYSHKTVEKRSTERQYLNIFQEEAFIQQISKPSTPLIKIPKHQETQENQHLHSINLRGSFEQLERSFNSNITDETITKGFCDHSTILQNNNLEEEMLRLREENQELKRKGEMIQFLARENKDIKQKYQKLEREINHLQKERNALLTQKLRCEVNWHKQIQQKQKIMNELDTLRSLFKTNSQLNLDRTVVKKYPIYQPAISNRNNRKSRSPNNSFYNK